MYLYALSSHLFNKTRMSETLFFVQFWSDLVTDRVTLYKRGLCSIISAIPRRTISQISILEGRLKTFTRALL